MRVVNHLFNLHEPSFKMQKSTYRCHKPALVAMAYIVFIMKLLFGIDDVTEMLVHGMLEYVFNVIFILCSNLFFLLLNLSLNKIYKLDKYN